MLLIIISTIHNYGVTPLNSRILHSWERIEALEHGVKYVQS